MILRELLAPADLTRAQIVYIDELTEVIIVCINENFMFAAF